MTSSIERNRERIADRQRSRHAAKDWQDHVEKVKASLARQRAEEEAAEQERLRIEEAHAEQLRRNARWNARLVIGVASPLFILTIIGILNRIFHP
jgi:hypothetical protein